MVGWMKHSRFLGVIALSLAVTLAACGAGLSGPSASTSSSLESVSCWTADRDAEFDDEIDRVFRDFAESIGAQVLGDEYMVEIRHRDADYFALYHSFIPAYGRLVETYWSGSRHPYAEWDVELKSELERFGALESCADRRQSWISS
jgi:hypothetical protein